VYGSGVRCQIVCFTWRVGWSSFAISKAQARIACSEAQCPQRRASGRYYRSTDCVAAARDRHHRWILDSSNVATKGGITASRRETSDPFHAGFFDVSALPTVSDQGRDVVSLPSLVDTVGTRICPTNQLQMPPVLSAAIADARKQRVASMRRTDQARCSLVPDNSQNKRCRPASRSSLPQSLEPRRHVLAPATAPRSWIPICSTSLVSWGLSRLGRRGVDDVPSPRGNIVTIIANTTWDLPLVKSIPRDADLKRPAYFRTGIRFIHYALICAVDLEIKS
jgi:hypothetical protein